jgi:hypothetical protein
MSNTKLDEIIVALAATGLPNQFTPEVSRLVVQLLRQIAQGQPVTMAKCSKSQQIRMPPKNSAKKSA